MEQCPICKNAFLTGHMAYTFKVKRKKVYIHTSCFNNATNDQLKELEKQGILQKKKVN